MKTYGFYLKDQGIFEELQKKNFASEKEAEKYAKKLSSKSGLSIYFTDIPSSKGEKL